MWVRINVREKQPAAKVPSNQELKLCVVEATRLSQLRELIALRLKQPKAKEKLVEKRSSHSLSLQLVYNGQMLLQEDDEKALGQIGVENGAVLHCLASLIVEVEKQQQLTCFPQHCTIDGGRVVHVLGERFPDTDRVACRFGRVVTTATIEDDGEEGGVSQLRCVAPAHPAGPVTLAVSFDGGATWLEGPTFWYYDPVICNAGYGVCVPSDCGAGALPVRQDVAFRQRWGNHDQDPDAGAGCA
mmetsp:Transcript_62665/g.112451  ORF Transcript_62665/g.112451 Transcript_62665/m.112451 type:complete len:243 (-) Transcript_62665:32-760(-)